MNLPDHFPNAFHLIVDQTFNIFGVSPFQAHLGELAEKYAKEKYDATTETMLAQLAIDAKKLLTKEMIMGNRHRENQSIRK